MKALAAEVTANFSKRLAPLGLMVKELTGNHCSGGDILIMLCIWDCNLGKRLAPLRFAVNISTTTCRGSIIL